MSGDGERDRRAVLFGAAATAALLAIGPAAAAARHARHKPAKPGKDDEDGGNSGGDADAGSPADTPIGPFDTVARWAIIVDDTTGAQLLAKAADEPMPPSSLTKLMTAYLTFTMLAAGKLTLAQTLPVSEKAWRMQGSKMFVPLGGQIAVADLIRGMIIQSGNDACIVLAEGISGSEDQFVALMNTTAGKLGMTHSHFMNATGWPADGHVMSARDIATLAHDIIHTFPQYYHFFSEANYKFNDIDQGNRNVLVDKGLADGLKTGHTDAGGFGICASSSRAGRRVIMVLNGMPSSHVRITESERLLEWAFSTFEDVTLFASAQTVDTAPVWLGAKPTVALASAHDVVLTLPNGWRTGLTVAVRYDAPIAAPVSKGQEVGTLVVGGHGVPPTEIPLVANEAVGRMALPLRSLAVLEHYVTGG